jgi:hypothetical protein
MLALSGIMLVESAAKIQTRMFRGPRRAALLAGNKARAGPDILPPVPGLFPENRSAVATQRTGQFMPGPANSAALTGVTDGSKTLVFQGKTAAHEWHEACDIDCRNKASGILA